MKTSSHVCWTAASAGIITFNRETPSACFCAFIPAGTRTAAAADEVCRIINGV